MIVENMNSPHKIEPRLGLVSFGGASLLDAPSVYAFLFCTTGLRGFCRGALGDLLTQSQPNTPREPALRYDGGGGLFFSSEDDASRCSKTLYGLTASNDARLANSVCKDLRSSFSVRARVRMWRSISLLRKLPESCSRVSWLRKFERASQRPLDALRFCLVFA